MAVDNKQLLLAHYLGYHGPLLRCIYILMVTDSGLHDGYPRLGPLCGNESDPCVTLLLPGSETQFQEGLIHDWPLRG